MNEEQEQAASCAEMAQVEMHAPVTQQIGPYVDGFAAVAMAPENLGAQGVAFLGGYDTGTNHPGLFADAVGTVFYAGCLPIEIAQEDGRAIGTAIHDYFHPTTPAPLEIDPPAFPDFTNSLNNNIFDIQGSVGAHTEDTSLFGGSGLFGGGVGSQDIAASSGLFDGSTISTSHTSYESNSPSGGGLFGSFGDFSSHEGASSSIFGDHGSHDSSSSHDSGSHDGGGTAHGSSMGGEI